MEDVRRAMVFSGAGVTVFAVGLLGGLGACAAGKAAAATKRMEVSQDSAKEQARAEQVSAIVSSALFLGSSVVIVVLILLATSR